jgi:peptidoglycan/LPS O-acetylase OafA/YrhL
MNSQLRFRALDGWRGVCALLVALFHIPVKTHLISLPFFSNSWLFVDFFFVLSGFVIAHAYGMRLAKAPDMMVFVIKRFGRLWPLHAVLLGCLVALELARFALISWYGTVNRAPFTEGNSVPLILQNLLLLQAVRPEQLVSWNGPSWSISVEFWAYILFSLITISITKYGAAIKACIAIASCMLIYAYSTTGMDVMDWLGFFRCFFGFFVGQLLYQFCTSPISMKWQSRWKAQDATVLEVASVLCVIAFVSAVQKNVYSLAAPIVFAGVIYVFTPEVGVISRLMTTKPFDRLGRYSYSIYMVHGLVIAAVQASLHLIEKLIHRQLIFEEVSLTGDPSYWIEFGGESTMICLTAVILAIVVTVSRLTWRLVERPGQSFFNGLAAKLGMRISATS